MVAEPGSRRQQVATRGGPRRQGPRRSSADLPAVAGAWPEPDADPAAGRELDPVAGVGHRLFVLDARLEIADVLGGVPGSGGRGRRLGGAAVAAGAAAVTGTVASS